LELESHEFEEAAHNLESAAIAYIFFLLVSIGCCFKANYDDKNRRSRVPSHSSGSGMFIVDLNCFAKI
jgi:hypothetical protein